MYDSELESEGGHVDKETEKNKQASEISSDEDLPDKNQVKQNESKKPATIKLSVQNKASKIKEQTRKMDNDQMKGQNQDAFTTRTGRVQKQKVLQDEYVGPEALQVFHKNISGTPSTDQTNSTDQRENNTSKCSKPDASKSKGTGKISLKSLIRMDPIFQNKNKNNGPSTSGKAREETPEVFQSAKETAVEDFKGHQVRQRSNIARKKVPEKRNARTRKKPTSDKYFNLIDNHLKKPVYLYQIFIWKEKFQVQLKYFDPFTGFSTCTFKAGENVTEGRKCTCGFDKYTKKEPYGICWHSTMSYKLLGYQFDEDSVTWQWCFVPSEIEDIIERAEEKKATFKSIVPRVPTDPYILERIKDDCIMAQCYDEDCKQEIKRGEWTVWTKAVKYQREERDFQADVKVFFCAKIRKEGPPCFQTETNKKFIRKPFDPMLDYIYHRDEDIDDSIRYPLERRKIRLRVQSQEDS